MPTTWRRYRPGTIDGPGALEWKGGVGESDVSQRRARWIVAGVGTSGSRRQQRGMSSTGHETRRRRRRREAATAFIFRAPGSSDGWCEARGETTSAERAREIRRGARERERESEEGTEGGRWDDRSRSTAASKQVRKVRRSIGRWIRQRQRAPRQCDDRK